jgi:two-component system cell cycle sensor histidine kinase/response regulator CckA
VSFASFVIVLFHARVLVADDDPELLESLSETLTGLGAEVIQASDGAQLIDQMADNGPFDLVVTDIAMPWMTGVSAMRAARLAGFGTPLIVMTALRDDTIPRQVAALGATLLRKPFEIAELESAVGKILAEHRAP